MTTTDDGRRTTETLLDVDSANKWFGRREVLHAASLWVHRGKITSLLGRNGCGKTTLLRITVGDLKPDAGSMRFMGTFYPRPRLHRLARLGLCYLPAREFLPYERTLREILALCAWPSRPVEPVVEELQLGHLLGQTTDELSGGERRRAEVASALLLKPTCLLVDEPFRGVAPADCELLMGVFRRYAAAGGSAVITGHEPVYMLAVADDVIWCHDGTTEWIGSPQEAVAHDRFRPAYLGPEYQA